MGMKTLDDLKKTRNDFIKSAAADGAPHKIKKKPKTATTKQTINIDRNEHIKMVIYCKKNGISFQDFATNALLKYLKEVENAN